MSENTQLTNPFQFNKNKITFSKPEINTIPGSDITYKRIRLGTQYPDGTFGDLILKTSMVFSYGVQENRDMKTNDINGYTLPLCMWNKDGASKEETQFTDVNDQITEIAKDHLLKNKDKLQLYDLERSELKKLNPLYWKREKGKIIEGRGPTLYPKLLIKKKENNKILTGFYKLSNDEKVEALNLKGKYCYVEAAVKYESIFIGTKISLQVKCLEANVRTLENSNKRLLRPVSNPVVSVAKTLGENLNLDNDGSDAGSGSDSDSDASDGSLEEEKPVAVNVKKVKRRQKTTH